MSGEVLVTNSAFAWNSGHQYNNSSRVTMGPSVVTKYMNGHRCLAVAQLYDTIFTDNNLTMTIYYATVDGGTWYSSNAVGWEAINGTAVRDIYCANAHAKYLRWRVDWQAAGGDSKTYVDYAYMTTHAVPAVDSVTSPRYSIGTPLHQLTSWNFTSGFPYLSITVGGKLKVAGCVIVAY